MLLAILSLGKTGIILTRSKDYVSIALASHHFIIDSGTQFWVAPIVSYNLVDGDVFKPISTRASEVLALILKYTSPLFQTEH
jgi:hypothetical protein